MDNMLANLGLKYLAGKLDGKKTYAGAVVLMLLGIGKIGIGVIAIVCIMWPDIATSTGAQALDMDGALNAIQAGSAMFGAGLAALGIGHKIEKTSADSAPAAAAGV